MRSAVLLAAALALAACGSGSDAGSPFVAGEWALAEGTADGAALPSTGATLLLEDGQASGTSFCNHYFGTYRLDGGTVAFEGLGGTEMGCEPAVMAAETAYLSGLAAVRTVAVEDGDLVLSGDGVRLRFAPVAPVADRPLDGTRWVLTTLLEGETASSTLGQPAVLLLDADGAVAATTGCRAITGTWSVEDGFLIVDDFLSDGAECPADVEAQDAHVGAVLQSGPAVEILENQLTLTAADGRGLVYQAQ